MPDESDLNLRLVKVDGEAALRFECPHCGAEHTYRARNARAGDEIDCPCGESTFAFSGDDFAVVQGALDEVGRKFRDIFKS